MTSQPMHPKRKPRNHFLGAPLLGSTWMRKNGSTFTVERVERGYAVYWLADGSKPQFRGIRVDRLNNYQRVA